MSNRKIKRKIWLFCIILAGTTIGVASTYTNSLGANSVPSNSALANVQAPKANTFLFLPLAVRAVIPTATPVPTIPPPSSGCTSPATTGAEWTMLAANAQRTSWTPEEVRCDLNVAWYLPIEPYISYKIQPIAANGKIYVSTARGLYAVNATNGSIEWVYPTEVPLGHSPTIATVNGKSTVFIGSYDRKIHAFEATPTLASLPIDSTTGSRINNKLLWTFTASAGFETNPLVINDSFTGNQPTVFAGNRDGNFYALDALTGNLKWSFQTDGPILYSAAYKNGVLYFASNDAHAYAVNTSGQAVWNTAGQRAGASAKLPGQGFHSFWPVIYTEKLTGKDYVSFTTGDNYRQSDLPNPLPQVETGIIFSGIPQDNYISSITTESGTGTYWGHSAQVFDVSRITNYYEDYAYRRTVFVLDRNGGQEYTFDSDGDSKIEYAPFTQTGVTHSGSKYPPVINGLDNVYYQSTAFYNGGWVSRGDPVGWKFGTHSASRVATGNGPGSGIGHASDEPSAFSSGGRLIYWNLCCDREAGSYDVTIPFGQANRDWYYWIYNLARNDLAPGYQQMYNDGNSALYNSKDGWQVYSGKNQSKNGIYGKHGSAQSAPVPYQGKLYVLRGNALLALSPTAGGSKTPLPTAGIIPSSSTSSLASSEVIARLESEIQKMLSAGHLRPGYHGAGFIDLYGGGMFGNSEWEFGEIFDYFQNPADTVVTLLQALPYISPTLQQQVKTYVQNNYGPGASYSITSIVHVGWKTGAAREAYDIPSDMLSKYATFDKRTTPICGSCLYWRAFPPYSFYAAWKYAQVFGGAQTLYTQMSSKLESPPADSYLINQPYILNLYIAGYRGFLELEKLAGSPETITVKNTYNRLLNLRTTNFNKDNPFYSASTQFGISGVDYRRTLSVARNFMFLTPELGDYMNLNIRSQVQTAVNEYNYVAPYWFVSKYDDSYGEGTLQHLYDYPAMFQAKAYILKESQSTLAKWLDVPAFYRGDLFYIQNLIAILNAPTP